MDEIYSEHPDYYQFRKRLLVLIAQNQGPIGNRTVNTDELANMLEPPPEPLWQHIVGRDLARMGLGNVIGAHEDNMFLINGAGVEAATLYARELRPRTLWARFDRLNWEKWGVIVALMLGLATLLLQVFGSN